MILLLLLIGFVVGVPLGVLGHRWWIRRKGYVPHLLLGDRVRVGPGRGMMMTLAMYEQRLSGMGGTESSATLRGLEILMEDRQVSFAQPTLVPDDGDR